MDLSFYYDTEILSLGVSPDFDLVFPKSSAVNFVRLRLKLSESSSLPQVSVCAWMRYSDVQNSGTLWSYATDRSGYLDDVANGLTARDSGNLEVRTTFVSLG